MLGCLLSPELQSPFCFPFQYYLNVHLGKEQKIAPEVGSRQTTVEGRWVPATGFGLAQSWPLAVLGVEGVYAILINKINNFKFCFAKSSLPIFAFPLERPYLRSHHQTESHEDLCLTLIFRSLVHFSKWLRYSTLKILIINYIY